MQVTLLHTPAIGSVGEWVELGGVVVVTLEEGAGVVDAAKE